ncbi:efflux RND transporter permease subunit, partial [Pseudomonas viridiflava]|uniref:efflux RND transporter permease subunit n=1 Tax=Pseudomonas viridiflava TaxID=33069 RepID=UPI00197D26F6
ATLSGIKHITTSIVDGLVTINVEFILEKQLSDALIETKDAVDRVSPTCPPIWSSPPSARSGSAVTTRPCCTR